MFCGGGTATCNGSGILVHPDGFAGGTPSYTFLIEDSEFTGIDGTAISLLGAVPISGPTSTDVTIRNTSIHDNPTGDEAIGLNGGATTNDFLFEDIQIFNHAGDMVNKCLRPPAAISAKREVSGHRAINLRFVIHRSDIGAVAGKFGIWGYSN